MHRSRFGVSLSCLLALCAPCLAPSFAGSASHSNESRNWHSLAGGWRLDSFNSDASDTAIDEGTHHIFWLFRGIARRRLHKYLDPVSTFSLEVAGDTLWLRWGTHNYPIFPDKGSFEFEDPDEGTVSCRDTWSSDTLENYREVQDGFLRRIMAVEAKGGAMHLSIIIQSPKLRGPVGVRYRYEQETIR